SAPSTLFLICAQQIPHGATGDEPLFGAGLLPPGDGGRADGNDGDRAGDGAADTVASAVDGVEDAATSVRASFRLPPR
ncbi:hypothetical protein, partial [Amycolatopsis sacchari]|uniref:hypothetical protein n=1 Tax=Amycolatopsis sacchari TaxID=115433 RepID=UPI003EBBF98C